MLEKIETLVYSSEHILDETLTLLARRESSAYAAAAGEELFASRVLRWLDATPAKWQTALRLMRKLADQAVSFTDCLSFALMRREKSNTSLASSGISKPRVSGFGRRSTDRPSSR